MGIDPGRSHTTEGGMARIYFQLSEPPPLGWPYTFTIAWQAVEYAMKRKAGVESDSVWIECIPEEVEPYHIEQIEIAVAQTNAKYRERTQQQAMYARRKAEQELQLQTKLQAMGKTCFPVEQLAETSQAPRRFSFRTFLPRWMRFLFLGK